MQINNQTLIEEMMMLTERATDAAKRFRQLPERDLNFRKHPEQWTVLECIEHLNRYGDFYLPAIEKAILRRADKSSSDTFSSGFLGNYFANLMRVKKGAITKMKTPADKNPMGSQLSITTIDRFLKQQEMLKTLLQRSLHADLTGTKVPISLTRWVRLRLGDTFRFYVYHIDRHIVQAEKVLS